MHLVEWQVFDLILTLEMVGFPCTKAEEHPPPKSNVRPQFQAVVSEDVFKSKDYVPNPCVKLTHTLQELNHTMVLAKL